jgi:hypothetical protein
MKHITISLDIPDEVYSAWQRRAAEHNCDLASTLVDFMRLSIEGNASPQRIPGYFGPMPSPTPVDRTGDKAERWFRLKTQRAARSLASEAVNGCEDGAAVSK